MVKAHWTKTSPSAGSADRCRRGDRVQAAARRPRNRRLRAALLATTALAAISLDAPSNAQTMWTGANSSDWTDPGNWSAGVPGALDTAVIDTLTPSTVLDAAGEAHTLNVGAAGFGFLSIEGAGTLATTFGTIGAGSDGAIHVTGNSASWHNSNAVAVGVNGNGSLAVLAGGTLTSDSGAIGGFTELSSGSGTVTVSGPGSSWHSTFGVIVGVGTGHGALIVEDAGTVASSSGLIGRYAESNGAVTVTGTGSTWTSNNYVVAGYEGTGALTVAAGGTVSNALGFIGHASGSNGAVDVSGTGSLWQNLGELSIGLNGTGTLTVEDGGTVSNTNGYIGQGTNGIGTATVTGSGSSWVNGSLFIGDFGHGTMNIGDGGTVTSANNAVIGYNSGSSGTVAVSGADAAWQHSGFFFYVGYDSGSIGTLAIEDGGTVAANNSIVASQSGSSGAVRVSGAGAAWQNAGSLEVGFRGTGALTIEDGGAVFNAQGTIATNVGSSGAVTVSGAGAAWQNSASLRVGNFGTGTLTVLNGGTVGSVAGYVGAQSGSVGTALVSGTGSSWQNTNYLHVGAYGTGELTVSDGGKVSSLEGAIGFDPDAVGAVMISGAGALWQSAGDLLVGGEGTGTLTLTDGGTASASQAIIADGAGSVGTLNIGAAAGEAAAVAGTLNAATLTFGAGSGAIVFNHTAADYLFNPVVSGTGSLNHLAGTTILTSDSGGFAGVTTVNGGTLVVNGTLGGTLDVMADGRLEGAGTVGTTTLAPGGTVAPGNSIGTLDVAGDIAFDAGSVYEVEVDPVGSGSDLIHATGTATLNGGSVAHIGLIGTYQPFATYTILTADGGVTGTFDDVSSDFAFLDPTLSYDPANVFLRLERNDITFCGVGLTFNQCATGEGAESLGFGNPVHDALVVLDEDTARAAFDLLSGEIHGSVKISMLEDSRFVREAATARVRAAFAGVAASSLPVLAYDKGGPVSAPASTDRFAAWGHTFGSWGEWDSDGNAASFGRSVGGFFVGGDRGIAENWRLGLLAGYSRTSFDADDRSSSGSSDNYHLGIYGGTQKGNLGLRAGAAYTWHDIETSRQIAFPGFTDTLSAGYDAGTAQAFGELGYRIETTAASFEPFANLAYVNVHTDGFAETGDAAALSSASSNTDATFSTLGVRTSTSFMLGATKATAHGMVAWRHAFGDITPLSTHAFFGGDAFTVAGTPIARNAAVIEAGLDLNLTDTATLGLAYNGQIASDARQHGFKADLALKF